NAQGQAEQWAIEMGGPAGLARQGWVPKTLTPGMKIKTVIHPLRDGNNGGQFMAVTLPDGTQMGNPNAAPSANAGGAANPGAEACGSFTFADSGSVWRSGAVPATTEGCV